MNKTNLKHIENATHDLILANIQHLDDVVADLKQLHARACKMQGGYNTEARAVLKYYMEDIKYWQERSRCLIAAMYDDGKLQRSNYTRDKGDYVERSVDIYIHEREHERAMAIRGEDL